MKCRVPADAVQNKINDLLRFGEPLVTENGMSDGKGDGAQSAGRLHHVQSELILVWLDQQGDGTVEQLIVGLLLGPESVVIMGLATEPQRSEQRDNPPQPLLEDDDCRTQPLLKAQARIDLGELIAGALGVKASSMTASIKASLVAKARKIVPSAIPAASAICLVLTSRPKRSSSGSVAAMSAARRSSRATEQRESPRQHSE